jgi:hypothetical protein
MITEDINLRKGWRATASESSFGSPMGGKEALSGKAAPEVEGILFKNSKNSDAPGAREIGIFDYECHDASAFYQDTMKLKLKL